MKPTGHSPLGWLRDSLFAQVLVVSIAGVVGMLLFIVLLVQSTVAIRLFPASIVALGDSASEMVFLIENVPIETEDSILNVYGGFSTSAVVTETFYPDSKPNPSFESYLEQSSLGTPKTLEGRDIRFRYLSLRSQPRLQDPLKGRPYYLPAALETSIELRDGRVLTLTSAPLALFSRRPVVLAGSLVFPAAIIAAIVAIGLRRTLRPLRDLEQAASDVDGTGLNTKARETGTEEIRRVARALNHARARTIDLIAERTRMFASVAHDIRTSLTRVQLQLDKLGLTDDPTLAREIHEVRQLIDDTLVYARADEPKAPRELINLPSFIEQYASVGPGNIPYAGGNPSEEFLVAVDVQALKRALNNLIDNAQRYGGSVSLSSVHATSGWQLAIDDDGPGIPGGELETVFEPFNRLETSRNRNTGGTGLGLGIARALLQAQGATLTLSNRDEGGLRATIIFPEELRV